MWGSYLSGMTYSQNLLSALRLRAGIITALLVRMGGYLMQILATIWLGPMLTLSITLLFAYLQVGSHCYGRESPRPPPRRWLQL